MCQVMDFYTKSDIRSSFHRIEELLASGIFEPPNSGNPLVRSALTELLILIRDLMAKAKILAAPVDFTDDVNVTKQVKNISDAVKFVRDAICHVDSENRNHEECNARLSYNIAYGKCNLAKIRRRRNQVRLRRRCLFLLREPEALPPASHTQSLRGSEGEIVAISGAGITRRSTGRQLRCASLPPVTTGVRFDNSKEETWQM